MIAMNYLMIIPDKKTRKKKKKERKKEWRQGEKRGEERRRERTIFFSCIYR